ncbi:hypothetical protein TNCV_1353631 [Trichonephila clavipes]|nr:hypothetical protein TNCV_1353631 [Trichonephila clavipes]
MIHLTRQLSPTHPWTSRDVSGPSASTVGDDARSAEAHGWDVCCVAPYPTMPAEQCAPILFNLALHCIGLSQLSRCLAPVLLHHARQSPTTFFFDSMWTSNTMSSTAGFTVIHPLCINTNNCG